MDILPHKHIDKWGYCQFVCENGQRIVTSLDGLEPVFKEEDVEYRWFHEMAINSIEITPYDSQKHLFGMSFSCGFTHKANYSLSLPFFYPQTNSKAFTAKTSCVRRRYSEFAWLKKQLQKNTGLV